MAVTETRRDAMPPVVDMADSPIARSRQRSIELYHLDPGNHRAPRALSASALREQAQRHGR